MRRVLSVCAVILTILAVLVVVRFLGTYPQESDCQKAAWAAFGGNHSDYVRMWYACAAGRR